ncbi:DinB family protein [Alkalihalobacillus pseudalcaliphilus]|uniref:DinB family protein n=1 Tax=Alkalihalobacillus pseudalcaliphilus TaxID=79884 RepID=UPI00064DFF1C|nr:DinB family protein [Alkalihalobacillus pseudalcaliphilus]KMK76804.1 damage-inducible protein DinB [Alkalihalobacillus pseudalcaliphilus]
MNVTELLRIKLLDEIEVGIRSMEGLLKKVEDKDWTYQPAENMRNLQELVKHIVAIPEVDLHIFQEKDEAYIKELERKYDRLETADELILAMKEGFQTYKSFMLSLSEEDFLTKKTTPFYLDEGETQAHWLIEEVSHFFHHRGQFFNYLKQLGYEVNMFDLYV